MKRECLGFMVSVVVFVGGCLPGDIRPEPGRVYVTAEASALTVEGFSTDDGWTIRFEKLLVGLGNVALNGDACNDYANAGYDRLFNFTLAGAQKLGEVYGLAGCEIRFRLRSPSSDSLLQNGVTAADREFMRVVNDLGPLPMDGPPPRTAVYARGMATRNNEAKRFDWKFIARYTLTDCANVSDGKKNTFLHLKAGDDLRRMITFHGEDLFREGIVPDAARRFDLLAAADANADGELTLEELAKVPAPALEEMDGGVTDAGLVDGGTSNQAGWSGFMTTELLPRMLHFDGNPCAIFEDGPGRGGGGPF
jgi:hypothetical protein